MSYYDFYKNATETNYLHPHIREQINSFDRELGALIRLRTHGHSFNKRNIAKNISVIFTEGIKNEQVAKMLGISMIELANLTQHRLLRRSTLDEDNEYCASILDILDYFQPYLDEAYALYNADFKNFIKGW